MLKTPGEDVYFHAPGVASASWDAGSEVVLVEWEGWANSAEFAQLLEAEILALKQHRCSRLLADCRLQRVLNPADQDRANREWLPKAISVGLKRFAVVVPESRLAEMNLKASLEVVPNLEVGFFAPPAEAREWLAR